MEISVLYPPGCGPVFKYFFKKHKELETISIRMIHSEGFTDYVKDIVLTIFSNINLRSISLHYIESSGDTFSCLPSTFPSLEKLGLTNWWSLSDQELNEILNRSRSNLRELDLPCSKFTGVGVEEGVNSVPNLEILNLSSCFNLTDGGLQEILRLSGNKLRVLVLSETDITGQRFKEGIFLPMLEKLNLYYCLNLTDGGMKEILRISGSSIRVLDVSRTRITGQGFKDGVSLPMLEELNLSRCRELTYSGLLEILSISWTRLKTVDLSYTRIFTAVRSTLSSQYPSVQFKY